MNKRLKELEKLYNVFDITTGEFGKHGKDSFYITSNFYPIYDHNKKFVGSRVAWSRRNIPEYYSPKTKEYTTNYMELDW